MSPVTKAVEAALERLLIDMRADRVNVESLDIHPEPGNADLLRGDEPARLKIVVYVTCPASSKP